MSRAVRRAGARVRSFGRWRRQRAAAPRAIAAAPSECLRGASTHRAQNTPGRPCQAEPARRQADRNALPTTTSMGLGPAGSKHSGSSCGNEQDDAQKLRVRLALEELSPCRSADTVLVPALLAAVEGARVGRGCAPAVEAGDVDEAHRPSAPARREEPAGLGATVAHSASWVAHGGIGGIGGICSICRIGGGDASGVEGNVA
eukprot:6175835-Pleurochrysis_carterae.AAC.3